MFRRHWKEVEARLKEKRKAENSKRQEAFLDQAYQERMAQLSEEDEEMEWDPIEDAIEDERCNFVDMMKHLLWVGGAFGRDAQAAPETHGKGKANAKAAREAASSPSTNKENVDPSGKALTKSAKKRAKAKAKVAEGPKQDAVDDEAGPKVEVNESRQDMRKRLVDGVKYNHMEGIKDTVLRGTIESPMETTGKVVGIPPDEVDKLLSEVAEIKLFLFCRLLLSQAAVLPNALKASSVEELLLDPEVATADLRDLCLRLEQPSLQEIRDACAEIFRSDTQEDYPESEEENDHDAEDSGEYTRDLQKFKHKSVPEKWHSKHEQAIEQKRKMRQAVTADDGQTFVDFGEVEDGKFTSKLIRVKVCGKTIWNYPSDKAMARGGWLHYSIIAKGSKLTDAIELCRNWDEFWDLNVLSIFQYFPAPYWGQWAGGRANQQMLQLGFIPYLQFDQAEKGTFSHSVRDPDRRRDMIPVTVECRNVIGAHIKRDDAVSRRFVQYLAMQAQAVVLLVRDAKTGQVLVKPPEDECWLARARPGGYDPSEYAGDGGWTVTSSVGAHLFEQISGKQARDWQFGFTHFYDIIIWQLEPGQPWALMYNIIQKQLFKAHRVVEGMDMYEPMAPVLKTLWRDHKTGQVRDAKQGEETVYDELRHENSKFLWGAMGGGAEGMGEQLPPNLLYNDIDVAEDMILFPEEAEGRAGGAIADRTDPITEKLERRGPNWKRFIHDLDSDQDSDDFEDVPMRRDRLVEGSRAPPLLSQHEEGTSRHERSGDRSSYRGDSGDDSEWVTDDDNDDCYCDSCRAGDPSNCEYASADERDVVFDTDDGDDETLRLALAFDEIEPPDERDPATDFRFFAEREAAKIFKQQWHAAVTDPEERAQHEESQELMKQMCANALPTADRHLCLNILLELRLHYHARPKVWNDMEAASAAVSIFFPSTNDFSALSAAATGVKFCIADNKQRAECPPHRRTDKSNLVWPEDFWHQATTVYKTMRRNNHDYYRDWDKVIRPLVAHCFKAGVIAPTYLPETPGSAAVLSEPGRGSDVYFDFRKCKPTWQRLRPWSTAGES